MKILVLTKYGRMGASSRVRCHQYLPYLRDKGFQFTVAPLLDDRYITELYAEGRRRSGRVCLAYVHRVWSLLTSRGYAALWIEKELLPWMPYWVESLLTPLRIPYIVDYDDATFHAYDLHPNRVVRSLLGRKIDAVIQQAALVTVGNRYLEERAVRAGARRVEYVPTAIDLDRYAVGRRDCSSVFTIGWIGTPITVRYVSLIHSALSEVCRRAPSRVVLVGVDRMNLRGVPTEVLPWSEESEVASIQSFDVGIMPLPDKPWERGKCGYKLIQYMGCGKAVVASPVGVNLAIVEDGVNGFLASSPDEWVHALSSLRDNPDLRVQMGHEGRRKVEEEYCTQIVAPRLASLLRSLEK